MANSLGGVTFFTIDGPIHPSSYEYEYGTRPGVDGVALHKLGKHGKETVLQVERDYSTVGDAKTASEVTFPGMKGSNVNIVIGTRTYTNYFVKDYEEVSIDVTEVPSGGVVGGPVWLVGRFTVIKALP